MINLQLGILASVILLVIYLFSPYFDLFGSQKFFMEDFSDNKDIIVRMFYVDWCGHCKNTKPHFKAFMKNNDQKIINGKKITIQMINCEENQENANLAQEMNVEGYPTIMASSNGTYFNYDSGPRTEDGFSSWIKNISK